MAMRGTRRAREAEVPWWSRPADDVLAAMGGAPSGLTRDEARTRLLREGPNALPRARSTPVWRCFVRQFASPLLYLLAFAAMLAAFVRAWNDAVFIALVLLVNALIGTYQEWKAEGRVMALQTLLRTRAVVEREGRSELVDAEHVVRGDIVLMESGNRVPADLRILAGHALEADESLLTGESLPVEKRADAAVDAHAPLDARATMLHAGCIVVRGRARGVVVATGERTQVGQVARDVLEVAPAPAPLLLRMAQFARLVAIVVLVAVALVGAIGVIRGGSLVEMFFFSVALAVSAIPEGLPVALTVVLAIGTLRMARRQVIVRKLAAVEGLGSCTLIASDKTGTLTCNELTVRTALLPGGARIQATGEGFTPEGALDVQDHHDVSLTLELSRLLRAVALCNEGTLRRDESGAWRWTGDPTDVALLAFAQKGGVERDVELEAWPQVGAIAFEPERRYAATYHAREGEGLVLVKGAPERVLAMCDEDALAHLAAIDALAASGHRILAVAEAQGLPLREGEVPPEPRGLRYLGLVGMIDPPRAGVADAIASAQRAGVRVIMVTGDHPKTAGAIARDLGIAGEAAPVTGADVDAADDAALEELVVRASVFARVTPHHKLRLVQAAQRRDQFVAVTGDGVNDAPALRGANIGIAMGAAGTDVAREAADIVIADDDLTSIVAGIEEGRVAYDNVRKVTFLLVSTGAAEVVLILLAVAIGSPLPLLPVQLLWLNLVTNGVQHLALALEPNEGDVMERKPRGPRERIFDRLMIERTLLSAAVMGGVGFAAFTWMLSQGVAVETARNHLLLLMVLFENVHIGNARSETRSAFSLSPLRNPWLVAAALGAHGLHLAAMAFPPTRTVVAIAPVTLATWTQMAALSVSVVIAIEAHKAWRRTRRGARRAS